MKTAGLYCLFVISCLMFIRGFFPFRPLMPTPTTTSSSPSHPNAAPFNRLVFMVVDALRHDFVFSKQHSAMTFTQSLIETGNAFPYTAIANAPTVTMPRLKAIISGAAPNFIDAVLNLVSSADEPNGQATLAVDSWPLRLKKLGFRLVFYGDDTWLRLFPQPHFFDRHEGTHSFFVQDTVEVDTNVTRNLHLELKRNDWDAMILHYLGLDHVGHTSGPNGTLMQPKQMEMDEIVKWIYGNMTKWDDIDGRRTLMVLLGDHGMTQMGNHGGSSFEETATAMVFIGGKHFSKMKTPTNYSGGDTRQCKQIDIVPTLAGLLGIDVPLNNGGVLLSEFESLFGKEFLQILRRNAFQLVEACQFAGIKNIELDTLVSTVKSDKSHLDKLARSAAKLLSQSYTDYSLETLLPGLFGMTGSMVLISYLSAGNIHPSTIALMILYNISFYSSSFVEEEHEIWYYLSCSLVLCLTKFSGFSVILAVISRLWYSWNQTGIKFANYQHDIRTLLSNNYLLQQTLLVLAVFLAFLVPNSRQAKSSNKFLFALLQLGQMASAALLIWYKFDDSNNMFIRYNMHWFHIIQISILLLSRATSNPHLINYSWKISICLISILLNRSSNALLFPLIIVHHELFHWVSTSSLYLRGALCRHLDFIYYLIMTRLTFYITGNSNSIATIDLSNSYIGIGKNMELAGLLTFLSTFSGPLCIVVCMRSRISKMPLFFVYSWNLLGLCVAVTILRNHLFIWSVFSPKVLYELGFGMFYLVSSLLIKLL